jgi:hypothetical protein
LESAYIEKRNKLVTSNLRLVAAVVKKLRLRSMDWEDLMQQGAISLQKAVESFDPSKGVRFSTYAVPVIKGDLVRAMENLSHEVRIPNHLWVKIRKYNRTQEELCMVLGRTPSHVEVALELGIPVLEAARLEQYQWAPLSLDAPHGQADEGMSLGDFLMDHSAQIPGEESCAHHEWSVRDLNALDLMDPGAFSKDARDGARHGGRRRSVFRQSCACPRLLPACRLPGGGSPDHPAVALRALPSSIRCTRSPAWPMCFQKRSAPK